MKNSKNYSQKIKKLYTTLKKTGEKVVLPTYPPLSAALRGVRSGVPDSGLPEIPLDRLAEAPP